MTKNISNNPKLVKYARDNRKNQPLPETRLWRVLKDKQLLGLKFRRQHPVGHYILDFYCSELALAIEVDGDTHADQIEYDARRSEWLGSRDIIVLRFSNSEVMTNLDGVWDVIVDQCEVLIEKNRSG